MVVRVKIGGGGRELFIRANKMERSVVFGFQTAPMRDTGVGFA
jgi:hypothetical protein